MMIQHVFAREILDSRGLPTVEVWLTLDSGIQVIAAVPSGVANGKYEAKELRDNDPLRMAGFGVTQAVRTINEIIAPALVGLDPTKQTTFDQALVDLDGTQDKSKLGANTTLPLSIACLKAGAASVNMPLFIYIREKYQLSSDLHVPTPIFTMISGGLHGAGNLDFQEFQIIPASNFSYAATLNMGVTLYQQLGKVLKGKGAIFSLGLGGGYAPNLFHNIDVFEILIEAIRSTPFTFGRDLFFGIDAAADQLLVGGKYQIKDRSEPFNGKELRDYYETIRKTYHVISIEDGYSQDEWKSWQELTELLGETTMVIGDSLISTNKTRLEKAIQEKACNSVLIKPNQIGTISETVEVISAAKNAGLKVIVSHRSGETADDFIADFAVGVGSDYVKFGAPARGERVVKYNRLSLISDLIAITQQPPQPVGQQPAPTATQA